jgi:copper resistance protein C
VRTLRPGAPGVPATGGRAWPARALLALVGVLLVGTLSLFGFAPLASAHDNALTSSQPAASAVVQVPPTRVTLQFRWRIKPGSTTVTVLGPDRVTQWQRDMPDEVGNTVGVALRNLRESGDYQVHYSGVSLRGYPFSGRIGFVLAPLVPTRQGGFAGLPPFWIAGTVLLTAAATAVGIRLGRTG